MIPRRSHGHVFVEAGGFADASVRALDARPSASGVKVGPIFPDQSKEEARTFPDGPSAPGEYAELVERLWHIANNDWRFSMLAHTSDTANEAATAILILDRKVNGYRHHLSLCEQEAGKALGYPWYKDDRKNFPGATETDGVCIGEHVGDTIVAELARKYTALVAENKRLREALTECTDDLEAELLGKGTYDVPRRMERDMDTVRRARAAIKEG